MRKSCHSEAGAVALHSGLPRFAAQSGVRRAGSDESHSTQLHHFPIRGRVTKVARFPGSMHCAAWRRYAYGCSLAVWSRCSPQRVPDQPLSLSPGSANAILRRHVEQRPHQFRLQVAVARAKYLEPQAVEERHAQTERASIATTMNQAQC